MKYIFCSSIYDMTEYDNLTKKSKVSLSLADHNLNYNIILGMDEVLDKPIRLINNVQIPSFPNYPKVFFHRQRWQHIADSKDVNCGFINFPVIKHMSRFFTTYAEIKREITTAQNEKICIFTYDIHFGISLAIRFAKMRYSQISTCAVLPDIPNTVVLASNGGKITWRGKLRAFFKMQFINQFDSYVFLTQYMAEVVDVSTKKYIVMEGIYNSNLPPLKEKRIEKKIIMYSGQLNPAYGITNLLDAFVEIYKEDKNYELWICGSGGIEEKIKGLAKIYQGIKYYGYVNIEKIQTLQSQATVLINPRQNIGDFTKYSFPSKTMEYLASGRPVIGYKLDGIPEEYYEYMILVEDNSIETLQKKIYELCEKSEEERKLIGNKARDFIITRKNPKIQCEKIVTMINELVEKRTEDEKKY